MTIDVNDKECKDWWNVGWSIKSEMLRKWFEKYVVVYADSLMSNEEINRISRLYDVEAERKLQLWFKGKNYNKCM